MIYSRPHRSKAIVPRQENVVVQSLSSQTAQDGILATRAAIPYQIDTEEKEPQLSSLRLPEKKPRSR